MGEAFMGEAFMDEAFMGEGFMDEARVAEGVYGPAVPAGTLQVAAKIGSTHDRYTSLFSASVDRARLCLHAEWPDCAQRATSRIHPR